MQACNCKRRQEKTQERAHTLIISPTGTARRCRRRPHDARQRSAHSLRKPRTTRLAALASPCLLRPRWRPRWWCASATTCFEAARSRTCVHAKERAPSLCCDAAPARTRADDLRSRELKGRAPISRDAHISDAPSSSDLTRRAAPISRVEQLRSHASSSSDLTRRAAPISRVEQLLDETLAPLPLTRTHALG